MNEIQTTEKLSFQTLSTWLGEILIVCSEKGILAIRLPGNKVAPEAWIQKQYPRSIFVDDNPWISEAVKQVDAYFNETLTVFDLPLDLCVTSFQEKVLYLVMTVPFGKTSTYGEIAKRLGNPGASRAVGMANNQNPIPVVIPCHRIVGSGGKLVGYAGGVEMKHKLLMFEQRMAGEVLL